MGTVVHKRGNDILVRVAYSTGATRGWNRGRIISTGVHDVSCLYTCVKTPGISQNCVGEESAGSLDPGLVGGVWGT